jgi:hypothetical protein
MADEHVEPKPPFRFCSKAGWVCGCNDTEAQLCLDSLLGQYLDAIRWGVLLDHADGSPGDQHSINQAHREFQVTSQGGFRSLQELNRWMAEVCQVGGLQRSYLLPRTYLPDGGVGETRAEWLKRK